MTSPPRRPIISLKFKTPASASGDVKPTVPPSLQPKPSLQAKPSLQTKPSSLTKPELAAKPAASAKPKSAKQALSVRPGAPSATTAPPKAAAKPEPTKKAGPAISPELFKAAVRAAGLAIQNVVADPEWKSEDLLHQYQAAKTGATSTNKQQAKLISTVATRRHAKDIEQADVESAAMRAAYAAALVALVGLSAPADAGNDGQEEKHD